MWNPSDRPKVRRTVGRSVSLQPAVKALLRKIEARTREALIEAIGQALEAVTPKDARGFLEHRGYRATAQLL